jgi:hypothetical protein
MTNTQNTPPDEDDYDGNPFVRLGDLLELGYPVGTLASAVENGIYTWDRFGRFLLADETARHVALDALAAEYAWQAGGRIGLPPREVASGLGSPYSVFGWRTDKLPDLDAIGRGIDQPPPPPRQSSETRKLDSALILIAALCKKVGIDLSRHGATQRIVEATGLVGANLSPGTVSTILKLIPDALDRRTNKEPIRK